MTEPIEVPVEHRCHLGTLTDELAEHARRGDEVALSVHVFGT